MRADPESESRLVGTKNFARARDRADRRGLMRGSPTVKRPSAKPEGSRPALNPPLPEPAQPGSTSDTTRRSPVSTTPPADGWLDEFADTPESRALDRYE